MASKIKLYMFTGSAPSITARLMLEHKGLDYKRVHLMVGPHAFSLLGRGFQTMTVPALKVDGRRVQGSREISRALDELAPQPPLFPTDPQRRRAVADAERFGEELQDAVRRIVLCAARRDPKAFLRLYRHANPLMRPAQRVSRRFVTRLATAGHRATDRAGQEDLAALPAYLNQIDALIEEGLLAGAELNAADLQIAPNVALLLRFDDLAPFIENRPVGQHAQRIVPDLPGRIGTVLPTAWLAPLRATATQPSQPGPSDPHDLTRMNGGDAHWTTSLLLGPPTLRSAR
jgi:glutathione S-transferase